MFSRLFEVFHTYQLYRNQLLQDHEDSTSKNQRLNILTNQRLNKSTKFSHLFCLSFQWII